MPSRYSPFRSNARGHFSVKGTNVDTDIRDDVRAAARGDREAAARLFDELYPRVFRYAMSRVHIEHEAEDVASETFARALRDLDRFKWRGGGFEAWLFRIASNLVIDHYRRTGRESPREEASELADAPTIDDPESRLLQGEMAGELGALVATLSPEQQEVLSLRFAAGLSTEETASAMKKRPNAVRQLQFRALESLRRKMTR